MPQTQVGASKDSLARLPRWTRHDPVNSPAALHPLAALTSAMVQAEVAQADTAQSDMTQSDMTQSEEGSLTAFHAVRSVPTQGTRTPRPVTLLAPLDGTGPASRGLTGQEGRASGCALAGPPGTP